MAFPSPTQSLQLLTGYSYSSGMGPCWQIDDWGTNPPRRYTLNVQGRTFQLQRLTRRYCLGTYDAVSQRYIPCPQQQLVRSPYYHCYTCFQSIAFNPAFYHVSPSQLSPRQQVRNRQPHCVYLAYFGPSIIKVGIAYHKRVLQRWLEQGARAALTLQITPDAYLARALEARISKEHNVPERITIHKKKQLLQYPYSYHQATLSLQKYYHAITNTLSLPATTPDIYDLQSHYFATSQPSRCGDADKQSVPLAGRAVGMVGDIVIYNAQERYWMSSLKQHLGKAVVSIINTTE